MVFRLCFLQNSIHSRSNSQNDIFTYPFTVDFDGFHGMVFIDFFRPVDAGWASEIFWISGDVFFLKLNDDLFFCKSYVPGSINSLYWALNSSHL